MSEIIVRDAEPLDLPAIQELQIQGDILTGGRPMDMDDAGLRTKGDGWIFAVAEIDGRVIGFIHGERLSGNWAIAHYFAVRRDFRGTDVFRRLGQYFIEKSKTVGADHILAYADVGNPRLLNFYKYFGFNAGGTYVEMIKEI